MIAMAPRAAGSVGHVPHAGGAAARLSGGIIWLETEGHASLMRSRRALGPARAPFFDTLGAVFSPARGAPCPVFVGTKAQSFYGPPRLCALVPTKVCQVQVANGAAAGAY